MNIFFKMRTSLEQDAHGFVERLYWNVKWHTSSRLKYANKLSDTKQFSILLIFCQHTFKCYMSRNDTFNLIHMCHRIIFILEVEKW